MVLISDISPGPSYFLMMQNPWSDYDPTCVDRHHDIAKRNAAKPHRRSVSTHEHKSQKQTRSQSLNHAAIHSTLRAPSVPAPKSLPTKEVAGAFASLQVHPMTSAASSTHHHADDDDRKHPSSLLVRSMSEKPMKSSSSSPIYEMPELLGGTAADILSDPKVTKYLVPKIEACLPYRFKHKNWKLSFSLAQHGASLHTLFRRVRRQESTIVVVETEDGDIFGGFATAPWTPCGLYFGTGESFVFTCHRKFEMFPWTRKNSLLLFSDENTIAMGGGSVSSVHPSHDQPHGTMILVE
ncbi:hypothetical protein, variant [Aphanomyces astaci]|uniref:Oxidation resistance protein 1 n=1 Tax=Aphanomyces astaci TaxID=112090 RepID=W4GY06_APHAT|nr:hypothetical protein, variant [Aphanomyces astaci]ETV83909.1 hypothetical protein, variant [Aphanomyces astaci]|eukprot:XP_009827339.1 hypothetical protein, variant [Aphanomyces astaci]